MTFMMRRFIPPCFAAVLTTAIASCGGGGTAEPALPSATSLSPEGARHEFHSFSPDGKRIAYWSPSGESSNGSQLWVANSDLTSPMKLPVTALFVAPALWSPDGKSLAVGSG